ncbi:MAG: methyltransferase domain-containing protein [Magnetococcus sp. THC-1_WYH]
MTNWVRQNSPDKATMRHLPKHRFDPAKAHKLLDPRWRLIDNPLELVRTMGIEEGMRVVDLGCGPGFFTRALLEAVGSTGRVAAVELQDQVLEIFRDQIGNRPNLEIHQTDILATGLGMGQWDVAFVAFTLHEVDVKAALEEANRIIGEGGRLMVLEWGDHAVCPQRDDGQTVGPPADHRLLNAVLAGYLSEAGFITESTGQNWGGCQYWVRAVRGMKSGRLG